MNLNDCYGSLTDLRILYATNGGITRNTFGGYKTRSQCTGLYLHHIVTALHQFRWLPTTSNSTISSLLLKS